MHQLIPKVLGGFVLFCFRNNLLYGFKKFYERRLRFDFQFFCAVLCLFVKVLENQGMAHVDFQFLLRGSVGQGGNTYENLQNPFH